MTKKVECPSLWTGILFFGRKLAMFPESNRVIAQISINLALRQWNDQNRTFGFLDDPISDTS